jgi:hypothetical protein
MEKKENEVFVVSHQRGAWSTIQLFNTSEKAITQFNLIVHDVKYLRDRKVKDIIARMPGDTYVDWTKPDNERVKNGQAFFVTTQENIAWRKQEIL